MQVIDMSKQLRIEPLEECCQHFLDLEQLCLHAEMLSLFDHFQVACKQEKILKFAGRAHGRVQELTQFCLSPPATTLRDVCRDRTCGSANLTAHSETLVSGQLTGYCVDLHRESVAAAPDIEFTEVLHSTSPFRAQEWQLLITNYLILIRSISGGSNDH
jgi:hypothetical protein